MRVFSRRAFLITAVLTPTLVGIQARIADATERLRRKFMAGGLVAIEDPHSVTLRGASGTHTIKFLGDGSDRARATFNRDGIATLSDFKRGDQVVVELQETVATDRGTRMELLYRYYYGDVTGVEPGYINTTGGRFRLDDQTRIHALDDFYNEIPLSDVIVGTEVHITVRYEPSTWGYVARSIGVEAA